MSDVERRIGDVYSLLQKGLVPQNDPAVQVPEQTKVVHQRLEASLDSGSGYPAEFSPLIRGNEPSGTYTRFDYFLFGCPILAV